MFAPFNSSHHQSYQLLYIQRFIHKNGILRQLLNRTISFCKFVCEIALVLLVIMVSAEVLGRNIFGFSFSGVEILAGYVLVLLTYLGGAVALSLGAVYRMALIDRWLRGNLMLFLNVAVHLFAILFLLTIALHAFNLVESSFTRNVTSQANPNIKLWPLQLAVPFGLCSMVLVLTANILTIVRQARQNATGVSLPSETTSNQDGPG